jgi:hypothetical protein
LKGELADETGGALYFQNPRIVAARERAGLVSRGLTNFGGQTPSAVIGDHSFYTGPRYAGVRSVARIGQIGGAAPGADQADFIAGGGAIFVAGEAEAFDPAATTRPEQTGTNDAAQAMTERDLISPAQTTQKGRDLTPAIPAELADRAAPLVVEEAQQKADDVGGMFVLPTGKTSTAPR